MITIEQLKDGERAHRCAEEVSLTSTGRKFKSKKNN